MGELLTSRKLGASWEGWAVEEVIRYHEVDESDCYFWATYAHAELDLLLIKNGKKLGFEFKYSDAPTTTRSMHIAAKELKLDQLIVLYPGEHSYPLGAGIQACGLKRYLRNPKKLGLPAS